MARRTGLGRGLDALIPGADDDRSGTRLEELPVSTIRTNPHQPRRLFDDDELESLAASIREVGVLQPVLVRPLDDGYELIAGERRMRAAQRAGLDTVPAVVRDVDDAGSMAQALVENLHREDLNPLEEAAAYQELLSTFGWTHEQVADRVGRSRAAVSNTLRLLRLPGEVQRLLAEGRLGEGHARAVLAVESSTEQVRLAHRAADDGLTVRQVEAAARAPEPADPGSPGSSRPRPPDRPAAELEVESRLGDYLDTRVKVATGRRGGKITISFADLDDLRRILDLIEP